MTGVTGVTGVTGFTGLTRLTGVTGFTGFTGFKRLTVVTGVTGGKGEGGKEERAGKILAGGRAERRTESKVVQEVLADLKRETKKRACVYLKLHIFLVKFMVI